MAAIGANLVGALDSGHAVLDAEPLVDHLEADEPRPLERGEALAAPIEDLDPEFVLQLFDLFRYSRLGSVQGAGRFGQVEHGVVLPAGVVMGDTHYHIFAEIFQMNIAGSYTRIEQVSENAYKVNHGLKF